MTVFFVGALCACALISIHSAAVVHRRIRAVPLSAAEILLYVLAVTLLAACVMGMIF